MENYETISLLIDERNPHIVTIQLNRPESLNALNTKMALEMIALFTELKNNEEIRTVIITGSGHHSFCVGADLKERKGMTNEEWKSQHDIFEKAYALIRRFPLPTIAAINGFALGGGLELALQCDIRIASETASIGLPEATLGIIPGLGGTQLLPRLLPKGLAKELLYTGKRVSVSSIASYGLFNQIVPEANLTETALGIAKSIVQNAPLSLKALKQAVDDGIHEDIQTALSIELKNYYICANSEDRLEGIQSFNEKRKPVWKNR